MAVPRSGELFFSKFSLTLPQMVKLAPDPTTRPTRRRVGLADPTRVGRVGIWHFFSIFFHFFQSIFPKFFRQDFGCGGGQSESPQKVEIRGAEGAAKNFFVSFLGFSFSPVFNPTRQWPWPDPTAKNPTRRHPLL